MILSPLTQKVNQVQPLFRILVLQNPFITQDILDLGLQAHSLAVRQDRPIRNQYLSSYRSKQFRIGSDSE